MAFGSSDSTPGGNQNTNSDSSLETVFELLNLIKSITVGIRSGME